MTKGDRYDALVVGAGPNGFAAAITLAEAGARVLLLEGADEVGGGLRSAALTLPGFTHDVCSAIHPLGIASPFFRRLPLSQQGLEWCHPTVPLAHPLDGGGAAVLHRALDATVQGLGGDGAAYRRLMGPLVSRWEGVIESFLGPLQRPARPLAALLFALRAPWPASWTARTLFREPPARALFAGLAAHAIQPLERPPTSAFALMLGILGHAVGWPFPVGGSRALATALAGHFQSLGGEIQTGCHVRSLEELPPATAVLLDVAPKGLLEIAGERLPTGYRRALQKYRYGPGAFKLDIALDGPVPWTAEACRSAGTVHVGGTLAEIAAAEREVWRGRHAERPFVLVAQQSLFDPSRAPSGRQTLWAYCHVPAGSERDMTGPILDQIERFAPGFRDRILEIHRRTAAGYERYNPNYVGGDINAGVQDLRQQFTRPVPRLNPYATPVAGLYLCSSATPPGGGVHGMCGHFAARSVLRNELRALVP